MVNTSRPLALVTGASSGIGLQLARLAVQRGHDLLVAADRPLVDTIAELRAEGAQVEALETDLGTLDGVDELLAKLQGRRLDIAMANAGHGLGGAFLDQDFEEIQT